MSRPGWLTRSLADVSAGDAWLGLREQRRLGGYAFPRRRADWRLGRWTAKAAVGAWLSVAPERVEILAAADGAPEAWLDGRRAPVSVSLSHRDGRALAAVVDAPAIVGCDLERIEPRSPAFVREFLSDAERQLLGDCDDDERARLANLLWSAKEAAAKVHREGLRLDVRHAVANPGDSPAPATRWSPLRVDWPEAGEPARMTGWWRTEPGWVMVVAGVPSPDQPTSI
jgi:4'-phosphopantetheinyl transferase